MSQFDQEEGRALTLKALKLLEKPPEVEKDDPFTLNATLATSIVIISSVEEYIEGKGIKFQPDYLHQVFRESNEIYGYKDLKITIFVTSIRLIPLVKFTYSEICEDADDLEDCLVKLYEGGYLKENQEKEFLLLLKEEQGTSPIGEVIQEYSSLGEDYIVLLNTIKSPSFTQYKPYLQAFLLLLIDGAQFPCDSEYWIYITLYRKLPSGGFTFAGLSTIYQFFLSLGVCRYRISQMLFLPNYQRKGHGGALLSAVYTLAQKNQQCKQISVEDPSEDFQVMRDITDSKKLIKEFKGLEGIQRIDSPQVLKECSLPKNQLRDIMSKTKLISQQIKRVYQIILYSKINKQNKAVMSEYADVVIQSLKTLFKPFQRTKNPVVIFEGGQTLNIQKMNFLQQSEKMQKRILDYDELFIEEIAFYEIIKQKLVKDGIL